MTHLTSNERASVDAVATVFDASWNGRVATSRARLTVAGASVVADLATLAPLTRAADVRAGLRFDKVVIRLMADLQASLADAVPAGTTVVVTVTAPIRLAGKTAAAIDALVRTMQRQRSARTVTRVLHQNTVRVRPVAHGLVRAPRALGFVHNPDSDAGRLIDCARDWLQVLAAPRGRATRGAERWLVASAGLPRLRDADRHVCGCLLDATPYSRILLVHDSLVDAIAP